MLGFKGAWSLVWNSAITICVISGRILNLSEPQWPYLWNGIIIVMHTTLGYFQELSDICKIHNREPSTRKGLSAGHHLPWSSLFKICTEDANWRAGCRSILIFRWVLSSTYSVNFLSVLLLLFSADVDVTEWNYKLYFSLSMRK